MLVRVRVSKHVAASQNYLSICSLKEGAPMVATIYLYLLPA